MAPPIGIRYYNCRNAGVGIIIWPQLMGVSPNMILWDAPSGGLDKLYINHDTTVDLSTISIPPTKQFYLSEFTMFGEDKWDTSQVFYYDPNSTITAYGVKYGGSGDGALVYSGCKDNKPDLHAKRGIAKRGIAKDDIVTFPLADQFQAYAEAVACLRIQEFVSQIVDGHDPLQSPWKGIVKWLSGTPQTVAAAGDATVGAALIAKHYQVTWGSKKNQDGTIITTFLIGPSQGEGVPPEVVSSWNAAVAKVERGGNLINEGVSAHT